MRRGEVPSAWFGEGIDVNTINDETLKFLCGIQKPASNAGPTAGSLNVFNPVVKSSNLNVARTSQDKPIAKGPIENVPIDTSKWEKMRAVVDSGATVPVLHPTTGMEYDVEESEGSRNGVEYECANKDMLANLGQKRMAVMTSEGTLRGYSSECAEVSKPLQSVRACVHTKHAVCFGLGPEGNDHLIINRQSGEVNRLVDDGINYLQELYIIPPNQVAAVQAEMAARSTYEDGGPGFGGRGS